MKNATERIQRLVQPDRILRGFRRGAGSQTLAMRSLGRKGLLLLVAILGIFLLLPTVAEESAQDAQWSMVHLRSTAVRESSGLGVSRRTPDRFWTHNDSGDIAQLFAFDSQGTLTGRCRLKNVKAIDWEDMACYQHHGIPRVLVADTGDNRRSRKEVRLYLFDEPDPDRDTEVGDFQTIVLRYPDGSYDCEAVAVDVVRGQIILVAKTVLPYAGIYTTPLPPAETETKVTGSERANELRVTATRIGTLAVPMATAMDIHPSSGDLWVVNYFQAYRFPCTQRDESIAKQLSAVPISVALPRWRQIEAVAVDDRHRVWITSEGTPAPFGQWTPTTTVGNDD